MGYLIYKHEKYQTTNHVPYKEYETCLYFDANKYDIDFPFCADISSTTPIYEVKNGFLFLKDYYVMSTDKNLPKLNGVQAQPKSFYSSAYLDVNIKIDFTGKLLIIKNPVTNFSGFGYGSMKTVPTEPWEYEKVIELVFKNGVVTETNNQSKICAQIRDTVLGDKRIQICLKEFHSLPYEFTLGSTELPWWLLLPGPKISINNPYFLQIMV